jgi:hypothetical protein
VGDQPQIPDDGAGLTRRRAGNLQKRGCTTNFGDRISQVVGREEMSDGAILVSRFIDAGEIQAFVQAGLFLTVMTGFCREVDKNQAVFWSQYGIINPNGTGASKL